MSAMGMSVCVSYGGECVCQLWVCVCVNYGGECVSAMGVSVSQLWG